MTLLLAGVAVVAAVNAERELKKEKRRKGTKKGKKGKIAKSGSVDSDNSSTDPTPTDPTPTDPIPTDPPQTNPTPTFPSRRCIEGKPTKYEGCDATGSVCEEFDTPLNTKCCVAPKNDNDVEFVDFGQRCACTLLDLQSCTYPFLEFPDGHRLEGVDCALEDTVSQDFWTNSYFFFRDENIISPVSLVLGSFIEFTDDFEAAYFGEDDLQVGGVLASYTTGCLADHRKMEVEALAPLVDYDWRIFCYDPDEETCQ